MIAPLSIPRGLTILAVALSAAFFSPSMVFAQSGRGWVADPQMADYNVGFASRVDMDIARPRVLFPTTYTSLPSATTAYGSHNINVGGIIHVATPVVYGATHTWSEPFQLVQDGDGYRYWRSIATPGDITVGTVNNYTFEFVTPPAAYRTIPAWVPAEGTVAVGQAALDATETIKRVVGAQVGGVPLKAQHWVLSASGIAPPRINAVSTSQKFAWWPKGTSGEIYIEVREL